MDKVSKSQISEFQSQTISSMGIIEYLDKNNLPKGRNSYGVHMDQPYEIQIKRMDAMEYLKTKIGKLETFDL